MVRFVFSQNKLIGSRLISWGCKESWQHLRDTPSHFSIIFGKFLIVESTMATGVRLNYLPTFKKKNLINCSLTPKSDELCNIYCDKIDSLLMAAHGKKYDKFAIFYFAWRVLLEKFFKLPLPKVNKFDSAEKFFCNELYSFISGEKMSMQSPNSLMLKMLDNELFNNCEI